MAVWLVVAVVVVLGATALMVLYRGLIGGALTIDVGWGRRVRTLGPMTIYIDASREDVFELLAQPYMGTDGWAVGSWWGRLVARAWERAVESSLAAVKAEAERRVARGNS